MRRKGVERFAEQKIGSRVDGRGRNHKHDGIGNGRAGHSEPATKKARKEEQ